jgi:ADP-ribosylglycohydrolase
MIGAAAGDFIGSFWEFREEKPDTRDTPLFRKESIISDDTVLTIATAEAILSGRPYAEVYKSYCRRYVNYGYGPSFMQWAHTSDGYTQVNNSWGNGSAMRVSPVGWAFSTPQTVMIEAQQSASITHAHAEGIKGSQATALAVYMARAGAGKDQIKAVMEEWFEYFVEIDLDQYHEEYSFDVSCQGTLPPAIACVLQANSFEEVMRNGLYIGGDTDTLLAIAGGIAEPLYGVPVDIREKTEAEILKQSPALLGTLHEFERKYGAGKAVTSTSLDVMASLRRIIRRI